MFHLSHYFNFLTGLGCVLLRRDQRGSPGLSQSLETDFYAATLLLEGVDFRTCTRQVLNHTSNPSSSFFCCFLPDNVVEVAALMLLFGGGKLTATTSMGGKICVMKFWFSCHVDASFLLLSQGRRRGVWSFRKKEGQIVKFIST